MGQIIRFEEQAVARLRERLGEAEEANEDLIAFARGHSDAVTSINAAVLEVIEAPSIEPLLEVITRRWPEILAIDFVAVALVVGGRGFRADCDSIERVEPAFVERMAGNGGGVQIRSVATGHPLFGCRSRGLVRAEAIIRIEGPQPFPHGLLALGQRAELASATSHASSLLHFLGSVVAATIRRCVVTS